MKVSFSFFFRPVFLYSGGVFWGLRGEKQGIMPTPDWKKAVGRGPWNPGETINAAIGQGDVLATPLLLPES